MNRGVPQWTVFDSIRCFSIMINDIKCVIPSNLLVQFQMIKLLAFLLWSSHVVDDSSTTASSEVQRQW